ncbi:flagellar M-ring protein FliF [Paraburkholderia acidicola]|uniref:Flagellar M-ring protein n=1 Tax=Paraburkholderia acidicola TaxID=1912599 RepID=A0A2A4ETK0_9BURK|nr:flagellar basal-body MS-ring/collar protein FliF [Paraburkholderia acidicola]PCE23730.1 flagellar M-ring protein FliF [Paraburkholderia acidicola]
MILSFWQQLGRGARTGLIAGVLCIVVATAAIGYTLLRPEYQVLFSGLAPQDAAAMVGELDHLKIPYVLDDNGTSILVDKAAVYKTRIKLMGGDLPLHGAVGFELFNTSDFGMTEFAQKINYQRALQGELTRTILSLDEIRDARVLLALPEQGLFKQTGSTAKASITLMLKPGQTLRSDQIAGIQRLVAAAVNGIAAQDVTIVDQTGVALTRNAGADDVGDAGTARLGLKKEMETYLARKAEQVLDRALGPAQGLVSIDVTLDMDRVQSTRDDVVSAPTKPGEVPSGVVVRERDTERDISAPLDSGSTRTGRGDGGGSSQREVEYAVGRRVEQVIQQPGSIRRIDVVTVVHRALGADQQEQLRKTIAASVGASPERGDRVVVQTIDALNAPAAAYGVTPAQLAEPVPVDTNPDRATTASGARPIDTNATLSFKPLFIGLGMALALAIALIAARVWLRRSVGDGGRTGAPVEPRSSMLSSAQRDAALVQLQRWLRDGASLPADGDKR